MRLLLGAFGDPGHAFPTIALGRALAARGHDVTLQTWTRWEHAVRGEGMGFAPAPEYHVFPTAARPLGPYEAVYRATRDTLPLVRELAPDAVVADILTLAPALAGEIAGCPVATLIPHLLPVGAPGMPPFSIGARRPRTLLGRRLWDRVDPVMQHGLRRGRAELNATRARLRLAPLAHVHGGISRALALVATLPQLEYPRVWPAGTHVVGPLLWEPGGPELQLPPGADPLVLVAPSTSQDPQQRLLAAALAGLARLPVRVLAVSPDRAARMDAPARRAQPARDPLPANVRIVDWLSYARTMPRCDVVVCHAGHGTLARALTCGCPVVACPAGGDMNENAARLDWAGAGVRLPARFVTARTVALAVQRVLGDPGMRARAQAMAAWSRSHDAAGTASALVEQLVARAAAGQLVP